jgi:hypothetical protein
MIAVASEALVILAFHVRDPIQSAIEILRVEKLGTRSYKLAARDAIREKNRHELLNREVVRCGELGGLVIRIFSQGYTLAHLPSSLFSSETHAVSPPLCRNDQRRRGPDVVRDNGVCPARYRELEREFIALAGQRGPQPEVDRGLAAKERPMIL